MAAHSCPTMPCPICTAARTERGEVFGRWPSWPSWDEAARLARQRRLRELRERQRALPPLSQEFVTALLRDDDESPSPDLAAIDGLRWSVFTMHWPAIAYAALVGRE